ncbi:hypothetical protein ABW19_dt0201289 [Dactylella cylindrospora]|nr:hypothetical protein ABW19_dt0201289 [Dactylella cylindrospora]
MSQRTSSISRYYPQILIITGVIVALGALHLHQVYTSQPKRKPKQLRRRNAQRQRNRLQSFGSGDGQQAATAEALSRLDGSLPGDDGARLADGVVADGISLPTDEALTTMLNNAGAAARGNREDGNESDFSYDRETKEVQENQNVLQLLYLIAEDQARQQGYVHRGVTCNMCNVVPIRGIRYRCSNCIDFDLCESCEAQDVHPKTHLFYKVRIPAPFLGSPRKTQQPVYPGKPSIMAVSIPPDTLKRFARETVFEQPEVEALYEQFKCLAATEFSDDPNGLGGGIDRKTFDKCFVPNNSLRPPPPNLIYDRMFAFFDTDGNGVIGFEEFVKGLSIKTRKTRATTTSETERHRRTFKAYDLDGDGFIERKDVLKMFRAYYALQKDLVKDLIAGMDEDVMESTQSQNVIHGSQPLSAAFSAAIPMGDEFRRGKTLNEEVNDIDRDALRPDGNERGRRSETMANALQQHRRDLSVERRERRNQRAEERLRRLTQDPNSQPNGQPNGVSIESVGREPRLREVLDDAFETRRRLEDARRLIEELDRQTGETESVEEFIETMLEQGRFNLGEVPEPRTDAMDDIIDELNNIAQLANTLQRPDLLPTSPTAENNQTDAITDEQPTVEEVENDEQADDHIPDTAVERAATPAPREETEVEPVVVTSPSPPVIPAQDFDPAFSSSFDLPDEWTPNHLKDPIRRPMKEELKLYYLEDYYKSDDDASDDEYIDSDWVKRKRPAVSRGLEREEDVGREILCQVVEQGINELLDSLFLAKEKDGLEVVLSDQQSQQNERPKPSNDENKENIDKTPPSRTHHVDPENPFSLLEDNADGNSQNSSSTASDPRTSPLRDPLARVRKEVVNRGGPGRISEQEFITFMQADTGRKLEFMGTWISMGSF